MLRIKRASWYLVVDSPKNIIFLNWSFVRSEYGDFQQSLVVSVVGVVDDVVVSVVCSIVPEFGEILFLLRPFFLLCYLVFLRNIECSYNFWFSLCKIFAGVPLTLIHVYCSEHIDLSFSKSKNKLLNAIFFICYLT